jgi:putative oxidoreductase
LQSFLLFIARATFGVLFLVPGIRKLLFFKGSAGYIAANGLPYPEAMLVGAIVLEIGAGLMLILGWRARWAAIALAIFVAVITPIFHAFWTLDGAQASNQLNHFLKNWAIAGGLVYIAAFGPGRFALSR